MTNQRRTRSGPEWVTFGVSAAVVAALIAILLGQLAGGNAPAEPVAEVVTDAIEPRAGRFHVPVEVTNEGGHGAQSVRVTAELATAEQTVTADQTIDFLGADETVRLVFVFDDDPATGALTVAVDGFVVP